VSLITRRGLLAGLACSGMAAPAANLFAVAPAPSTNRQTEFLDILRVPDSVTAFSGLNQSINLRRSTDRWENRDIRVTTTVHNASVDVRIAASDTELTHIRLRWTVPVSAGQVVLGDAWERSYGDLHWSSLVPERVMPWYFLTSHIDTIHGYGVKTGANALCFWQLDLAGVTLWLNLCNGGSGVALGERELLGASVVCRQGTPGELMMSGATAFCRMMCEAPRPTAPIYGSNDWYYAYGRNTAEQIVHDAELVSSLSPTQGTRPFTIIDAGWENKRNYPDMAALAAAIRERNVRPGLWIRPLRAQRDTPQHLRLPSTRFDTASEESGDIAYDPTIPEALTAVLAKVSEAKDWGYELVKHDFTTYDLLGQWGSAMKAEPTKQGWSFHDRSKTNAEIIRDLYNAIRRTAGDHTIVIGCNTIGHLSAGIFEAQRVGDDVSGNNWERTRRMGVNALAYRLPQHRRFFLLDADCVPITKATPWSLSGQWLDLLARSDTVLLVSPEPAAIGQEQREAVRRAFQLAAAIGNQAIPVDWLECTTPGHWEFHNSSSSIPFTKSFDWYQDSGAWPYDV